MTFEPLLSADPGYLALIAVCVAGILYLVLASRPTRLFLGGRGRIPMRFEVKDIPTGEIPVDARKPLEFLTQKLSGLGFESADLPVRVPALQSFGYRLLLVPFVNHEESTFFLMGIEAGLHPRTVLMLHILTPLSRERRVETSTLAPLENLLRPPDVHVEIVVDAESVEEIWSRHRRALTRFERSERTTICAEHWRKQAAAAYEAWVQSGVRGQWLRPEKNGQTYRVRSPPKSVF